MHARPLARVAQLVKLGRAIVIHDDEPPFSDRSLRSLVLILIATMNIAEKVKKTRKEEKTTSNLEDVITMDYR